MKFAVKLKDNHYACPCCEFALSFADAVTTEDRGQAKGLAKARGGRVVRVLSHEEAKRKAAAVELCAMARDLQDVAAAHSEPGQSDYADGYSDAARDLEKRAEALWPALFHAGDGRKPKVK